MIQGHLISHGYKVQNMRMLASLKQVDVGVLCVFRFRTKRSIYVSCTNTSREEDPLFAYTD